MLKMLRCLVLIFSSVLAGCVLKPLPIEPLPDLSDRLGSCVMKKDYYLSQVPAYYPYKAREVGQEGYVFLLFDIKGGEAKNIEVLASSPAGIFEEASISSLKNSMFKKDVEKQGCASYRTFLITDREPSWEDAFLPKSSQYRYH